MQLHLLQGELVLVYQLVPLPDHIQIVQVRCGCVVAFHRPGLGVEVIRVHVKIKQIFGIVLPVTHSPQTLELLVLGILGGQVGQLYGVGRILKLLVHILLSLF